MIKQAPRTRTPAKIISLAAPRSYGVMAIDGEFRGNPESIVRPTKLKFDIKGKKKMHEFPAPRESPRSPKRNSFF